MTIKQKLTLLFALFGVLVVSLLSSLFYIDMKETLEDQQNEFLEVAVDSRVTELRHIVEMRQEQVRQLADSIMSANLSLGGGEQLQMIQEYIESVFESHQDLFAGLRGDRMDARYGPIDIIGVWDADGRIIANTNRSLIGRQMPEFFLDRIKSEGSWFSGYRIDPISNTNYLMFLEAITDPESGDFAGAVIIKVRPNLLNRLVQNPQGLGTSGEVLLVQKDLEHPEQIKFITGVKHGPAPVVEFGEDLAEPGQRVLRGESGRGILRDYRGEEVSAVWRVLPEFDWGIVAKMDTAEFYAPIYRIRNGIILFGVLVLLIAVGIAWLLARSLSNPVEQLAGAFMRISRGEVTEPIPEDRKDELGLLAHSANRTIDYLARIKEHAKRLAEGKDNVNIELVSDRDDLGRSLQQMTVGLRNNRRRIENLLDDSHEQNRRLQRQRLSLIEVNLELEESRARTQAILEASADAIITINENGVILSFNPAAEEMFGYTKEEVTGRHVQQLLPSPYSNEEKQYIVDYLNMGDEMSKGDEKIIEQGRETVGKKRDGTVFPIDIAISEIRWKGRRIFAGIIRDLTTKKELERRLLEIGEEERQRIGRELHDGLGQMLTGIRMVSESMMRRFSSMDREETEHMEEIVEMIREADEFARNLSRGMVQIDLKTSGIGAALENLCRTVERLFDVRCVCSVARRVQIQNQSAAVDLYRIVQESITNAVKHGDAGFIRVRMTRSRHYLVLIVEDDGKGFEEGWEENRGMGVEIMRHRAGTLNGTIEIVRTEDGHTRVRCTIPFESIDQRSDKNGGTPKTTNIGQEKI